MEFNIKNNTDGTLARVTNYNQLSVRSESFAEEAIESIRGNSYIFYAECHLAAASSGGLLYIKNTSNTDSILITIIYFDAHTLTTPVKILQVKQPASVSNGTDKTSSTSDGIIQKNFGKPDALSATFVVSDGSSDMTYTGGQQSHAFYLGSNASQQRNMRATNIITPDTTWLLGWSTVGVGGGNATNGETIGVSVNAVVLNLAEFGEG